MSELCAYFNTLAAVMPSPVPEADQFRFTLSRLEIRQIAAALNAVAELREAVDHYHAGHGGSDTLALAAVCIARRIAAELEVENVNP